MGSASFLENYKLEGELLEIYEFPDPILKKMAKEVTVFDDDLAKTVKNMLYTMYNAPGLGLAAPQIGISQRFFVMDIDYDREKITNADGEEETRLSAFNPQIFINPKLSNHQGEIFYEEGCLSVPGIFEKVKRSQSISVVYQDLQGQVKTLDATDLLSICIQHETDHLDGIVFLERLSLMKRKFIKKQFLKERNKSNY